jgi:hypothetical protein
MHTKIHVNQHVIRRNAKRSPGDLLEPVLTVKRYQSAAHRTHRENGYGYAAEILDAAGSVVARVVYRPESPLPCGAKVWVETDLEVRTVLNPEIGAE